MQRGNTLLMDQRVGGGGGQLLAGHYLAEMQRFGLRHQMTENAQAATNKG